MVLGVPILKHFRVVEVTFCATGYYWSGFRFGAFGYHLEKVTFCKYWELVAKCFPSGATVYFC